MTRFRLASRLLVPWLLVAVIPVHAADPLSRDTRSITVESSLKDLSRSNDAAITGNRISATPGRDALGQPRTDLVVTPRPDAPATVGAEVQSRLHKLNRETVTRQTPDGRKARVQQDQDLLAEDVTSETRAALSDR